MTLTGPQVVEPAMVVKDRIRVAKGRFLIPGSIKKIVLRDTSCIVLEWEKIFQSWHGVKLEAGYCCEVFLKLFLGRIFFLSFVFVSIKWVKVSLDLST